MFEWSMRLEYDDFGILIALKTGGKYYCLKLLFRFLDNFRIG